MRAELATNAANAHDRAQLIAAALRDLGGVPDVVTPALGRATALAKTVVEQGQPIAGALFGDLALEHQLLDRAGYLEALADTAGNLGVIVPVSMSRRAPEAPTGSGAPSSNASTTRY